MTDPCVFYKKKNGKLVLIATVFVDDTILTGEPDEMKWFYKKLKERFTIDLLGPIRKHLGIWWKFEKDENEGRCLVATMQELVTDIIRKYEEVTSTKAKEFATPASPGQSLPKWTEEPVEVEHYRSLVGKILYLTTKPRAELSNPTRELCQYLLIQN